MERTTFPNRPVQLPPRTRIEDFVTDAGVRARVSLRLREPEGSDRLVLDAQAFEVDADGRFINAPDGRPSRTPGTGHAIAASSLGDTHTLQPGWVRIVGDYDPQTFEPSAAFAPGKPSGEPDWEANPTGQHCDTDTGIGYRWDEGEVLRIARGKAEELDRIVRNSTPMSGIDF